MGRYRSDGMPRPVTTEQQYLAGIYDELRALNGKSGGAGPSKPVADGLRVDVVGDGPPEQVPAPAGGHVVCGQPTAKGVPCRQKRPCRYHGG